jgi:hypothetical protein
MRDDAEDANLPRRIDGPGDAALPAASAASPTASASDGDLSRRIGDAGRLNLSDPAAASATAPGAQVRRTRIILLGPALNAPALFSLRADI